MMTKWFRIAFDHALTHAVSEQLLVPLVADMTSRGCPIEDFEKKYGREHARALGGNPAPLTEWAFDIGGCYFGGMPVSTLVIPGLSIEVPCDMFTSVARAFGEAKLRYFGDGSPYYKLKFWMHATVLTPAQFDEVCGELGAKQRDAIERSDAYFDKRKASTP